MVRGLGLAEDPAGVVAAQVASRHEGLVALVEAGVVDEIIWITAPVVFGEGPLAMGETPTTGIHRWNRQSTLDLDGDLWNFYRP